MSKIHTEPLVVILLAYFHRYGWIATMTGCVAIWPKYTLHILCAWFLFFSLWSVVGYICKWKHIYCSYQNSSRQKMTPYAIHWNEMKKSEAYGVPAMCFVVSVVLFIYILLGQAKAAPKGSCGQGLEIKSNSHRFFSGGTTSKDHT